VWAALRGGRRPATANAAANAAATAVASSSSPRARATGEGDRATGVVDGAAGAGAAGVAGVAAVAGDSCRDRTASPTSATFPGVAESGAGEAWAANERTAMTPGPRAGSVAPAGAAVSKHSGRSGGAFSLLSIRLCPEKVASCALVPTLVPRNYPGTITRKGASREVC